jgi:rRNA maturation endonuclease Nob1
VDHTLLRDIATRLGIGKLSSHIIVQDIRIYQKLCARWVSNFPTEKHKHCHSDVVLVR